MKTNKSFLRSAIIISIALVFMCIVMPDWNAASVIAVVIVALLAAFQWVLFFYLKGK